MSKHLTLEDQIVIETQRSVGTTPAEITKILCKAVQPSEEKFGNIDRNRIPAFCVQRSTHK